MTDFEYVARGTVLRESAPFDTGSVLGEHSQLIILPEKIWRGERVSWLAVSTPTSCGIQYSADDKDAFNFVAIRTETGALDPAP